jgi:hypothetical protein
MSSKKYRAVALSVLLGLTVIVGTSLVAIQNNDQNVAAVQSVRHTTVSYHGVSGVNALTLLKRQHQVQTKTYSGFGEEVIGIDGVLANSKHYWAFYVNGKLSQVGAGSYTAKSTDMLTWKLESL